MIPQLWAYPLLTILNWWMQDQAIQLAHLGAVGIGGQAVLLAGAGGSGKSSTAISCLLEGFEYLGDDHCFLRRADELEVFSAYSSGKLEKTFLQRFPSLAPHAVMSGHPEARKAVVYFAELFPDRIERLGRVRAIVVPSLSTSDSTILEPLRFAEAFRALATSFLIQTPGAGSRELRNLRLLLEGVPTFRLRLGRDGRAGALIRRLLGGSG